MPPLRGLLRSFIYLCYQNFSPPGFFAKPAILVHTPYIPLIYSLYKAYMIPVQLYLDIDLFLIQHIHNGPIKNDHDQCIDQ